jgi:hypothetical protein
LLSLLGAILVSSAIHGDERILDYSADIRIEPDGAVEVTETIEVQSEGRQIRRGIYRDFPTRYRDRLGNRYRVTFEVIEVRRNGAHEDWRAKSRSNGVRVYAGSAGRILKPGVHRYEIRYRTDHQLGFFEDFDEFYWNVTGTGWVFPIERAAARVTLPAAVAREDLRLAVYTGRQGATERDATISVADPRTLRFSSTRALGPGEGLTIAIGFPKGLVREPTREERIGRYARDNKGAIALALGLLAALAWHLWAWNNAGRDPRRGVIIPRFEPPDGLSPAACRYVLDMGLHRAAFTAAVISLGVKGYLTIEEDADGEFTLRRRQAPETQPPSPGESRVLESLLPGPGDHIALDNDNHADFRAARSGLSRALAREYKGRLFRINGLYALPALVPELAAVFAAIFLGAPPPAWIGFGLIVVAMHGLFIFLMRAPTPVGRKIMDEIEGFREYLDTAEQDRLEQMRSPTLTPQLFEAFLPYAFALGVENSWSERFQREFPEFGESGGYQSAWYHGGLGRGSSLQRIGSGLGAGLSSAIASASTPPGSSSGSGGGGFSGGGGGGGGGGGW